MNTSVLFHMNSLENERYVAFKKFVLGEGEGDEKMASDIECSQCKTYVPFVAFGPSDDVFCKKCYDEQHFKLAFEDPSHVRVLNIDISDDHKRFEFHSRAFMSLDRLMEILQFMINLISWGSNAVPIESSTEDVLLSKTEGVEL